MPPILEFGIDPAVFHCENRRTHLGACRNLTHSLLSSDEDDLDVGLVADVVSGGSSTRGKETIVSMIVDARQVHRARTELFETGGVSEPLSRAVRPEILASWRRSAAFGAQSNVSSLPHQDDLPASTRLLEAAAPVLRALAASLSGLHAGVLLADRDANIVQRWVADPSILRDLDRICSDAGFGAPEHCVGTNGIGTVAELGRAQMVVGPEHFADALVPFTCVGAPIFSPTTRRREGLVTLSCKAEAANALLTPLMISTAADIENRLLMSATLDERRVLDAYIAAKRERGLVAAIGRDLLIAGAKVTRMLDQLDEAGLRQIRKQPCSPELVGDRFHVAKPQLWQWISCGEMLPRAARCRQAVAAGVHPPGFGKGIPFGAFGIVFGAGTTAGACAMGAALTGGGRRLR